jgi:hypothetical protein
MVLTRLQRRRFFALFDPLTLYALNFGTSLHF